MPQPKRALPEDGNSVQARKTSMKQHDADALTSGKLFLLRALALPQPPGDPVPRSGSVPLQVNITNGKLKKPL
jgi:hypothetical protein